MLEKLRKSALPMSVLAAAGLLLSGCSGGSTAEAAAPPAANTVEDSDISRNVTYYPDGSRIIDLTGHATSADRRPLNPSGIYAFCDGRDLVEETLGRRRYPAGGLERTPDHRACKDGKLTETDFIVK